MPKTENRGGARVANPDYKKIRIEAFDMIAKLITSNEILTQSLKHNEILQRKCLNTIKDMKAKIEELKEENESLLHDWRMCDEVCDAKQLKINELEKIVGINTKENEDAIGVVDYCKLKSKKGIN
jgi:FtsZ-binding cell division protein ZapB